MLQVSCHICRITRRRLPTIRDQTEKTRDDQEDDPRANPYLLLLSSYIPTDREM